MTTKLKNKRMVLQSETVKEQLEIVEHFLNQNPNLHFRFKTNTVDGGPGKWLKTWPKPKKGYLQFTVPLQIPLCFDEMDFSVCFELPEPPKGEVWHNPENLDTLGFNLQSGERPCLNSEVGTKTKREEFVYLVCSEIWRPTWENSKRLDSLTYKTKAPLPTICPSLFLMV